MSTSYCPGKLIGVGGNVVGRGFESNLVVLESGFCKNGNIDVKPLLWCCKRSEDDIFVCQERFNDWKSRGIKIIPVFSNSGSAWNGERGYVQNAFIRTMKIVNPSSTGAILCGRKKMHEEVTKTLVADCMSEDRILSLCNRLWAVPGFEDL